jgi:hypothetical protein
MIVKCMIIVLLKASQAFLMVYLFYVNMTFFISVPAAATRRVEHERVASN